MGEAGDAVWTGGAQASLRKPFGGAEVLSALCAAPAAAPAEAA